MATYSLRILPIGSNALPGESIEQAIGVIRGTISSTPSMVFEQDAPMPRSGFSPSSVVQTDYGFRANFLVEEQVSIPTIDGEKKEFRIKSIVGKYLKKEGILLIGTTTPKLAETICDKWLGVLFPDKIVTCVGLKLDHDQFIKILKDHSRTLIEVSHVKCKGVDKIRIHAFDLMNKDWYLNEHFESEQLEQITFVPILTGDLAKKTPICRIYRDGKFVVYDNSKFSEPEFERIEQHVVDILAQIFGSPLCHLGARGSQTRLTPHENV